jgi:hypothetical protein
MDMSGVRVTSNAMLRRQTMEDARSSVEVAGEGVTGAGYANGPVTVWG